MAAGRQRITGLSDLVKTLEKLGDDIRDRDMNYATRKGANEIRDEARRRVAKDTGRGESNIVSRKDKGTKFDAEYFVAVRASGKAASERNSFYLYFVEYGTAKMAAQPFMRPAWEHGREPALRTFEDRISRRIRTRRNHLAKGKLPR